MAPPFSHSFGGTMASLNISHSFSKSCSSAMFLFSFLVMNSILSATSFTSWQSSDDVKFFIFFLLLVRSFSASHREMRPEVSTYRCNGGIYGFS